MSIQSEITKLDAVRDALVVSVNAKGAALSGDATLWQVKNAVDNITADTDAPVVTQPVPTVSINSSTGKVTAKYTPVAGLVEDTGKKSGELQLTVQAAQTITPGTSNKTIAAGLYLTGAQTIKGDSNLVAGNIKSGVSIFGVTGSYSGGTITLPETTAVPQYILKGYTTIRKGDGVGYNIITGEMTTASTLEVENELNFTVSSTVDPAYIFDDYTVEGKGVTVDPAQSRATANFHALFKPGKGDVLVLNSTIPGYFEYNSYAEKTMEGPAHLMFRCAPVPLADGEYGGRAVVEGPLLVGGIDVLMDTDPAFQAENIKKGVSMWGVVGTYEGSTAGLPSFPESCVAYLGRDRLLYIKQDSGITVTGLTLQSTTAREGWDAYGVFEAGPFEGSVLSKETVYLEWNGFSDFTRKWTLHTLVSGYPATAEKWPSSTARFAWGFSPNTEYEESGPNGEYYMLQDLPCCLYGRDDGSGNGGGVRGGTAITLFDGSNSFDAPSAGFHPAAFTWDGLNGKAYILGGTSYGNNAVRTTIYPYDSEMGMPGEKYLVGRKLWLGRPDDISTNHEGYTLVTSGMVLGGFALELEPEDYTDPAMYISPFLDGTYKNI